MSFKEIIKNDNWVIVKALQGLNGKVRIDAITRHHIADGVNHYSEWLSIDYVNRIRRKYGLKKIQETQWWVY